MHYVADGVFRDTFVGAYAVQWVKEKHGGNWDLRSTVQYACQASAHIIQHVGCQEPIPWASDLIPTMSASDTVTPQHNVL